MDAPAINTALNLAFPIRWVDRIVEKDGKKETRPEAVVWAYHTPCSREVFEANYRIIAAAHADIFSKGLAFAADSGPLIAALALRDAARREALELGVRLEGDPAGALMAELKRLTMVLTPSQTEGFQYVPVDLAISKNIIDKDDWGEAESSIAFFTCGLWMVSKTLRDGRREALALVIRGSTTSLQPTEFLASLATSTPVATTEVPQTPISSLPS